MDLMSEYRSKLRTAEEAVRLVKNGDWVDYQTAGRTAQCKGPRQSASGTSRGGGVRPLHGTLCL